MEDQNPPVAPAQPAADTATPAQEPTQPETPAEQPTDGTNAPQAPAQPEQTPDQLFDKAYKELVQSTKREWSVVPKFVKVEGEGQEGVFDLKFVLVISPVE